MSYPTPKNGLIKLLFSFLFFIVFTFQSYGRVWYVSAEAMGSQNGSSWANASNSVNAILINYAAAGDQIWVSKGAYSYGQSLILKSGIEIYGGFSGLGYETSLSERNISKYETILESQSGLSIFTTNGALNASTILDGFSFRKISFVANMTEPGIKLLHTSSLSIRNCKFYDFNNSNTSLGGGAIYISAASNPLIINCAFYNNTAAKGTAIYIDNNSKPTILNSTFYNNNTTAGVGGAIYISENVTNGNVTNVINSILYNNSPAEIVEATSGYLSVQYSDIKNGYSGTGNINLDPKFKNTSEKNLKLTSTSPCLQVGDNSLYNALLNLNTSIDLDNKARLSVNIAGTSSNIDMGAYQFSNQPSNFSYSVVSNLLSKGTSVVSLTPYIDGLAPFTFTNDKPFPAGLVLNSATGAITGTPSAIYSPTIIMLTANNASGTITTTIHITVNESVPVNQYPSPVSYVISQSITPTLQPVNTGGSVSGGLMSTAQISNLSITNPRGAVFDNAGNLFISTATTNSIYKITPAGTTSVFATGITDFNSMGIAIDAGNNLYVSNKTTKIIHKITSAGVVSVFKTAGDLVNPSGMVVGRDGYLYVVNTSANNIVKINLSDATSSVYASNVAYITTFDAGPNALVFDSNDNIFTLNADGSLSKIYTNGTIDKLFHPADSYLRGNSFLDIDAQDNIYISSNYGAEHEHSDASIQKINPIGDRKEFAYTPAGEHFAQGIKFTSTGELIQIVNLFTGTILNKYSFGKYSIKPTLPAGLIFDTENGQIGGTPTAISSATDYTISATNPGGTSSTILNLEVLGTIVYNSPNVYTKGTAITTLTPNTNGVVATSYSISPALPNGLQFNTTNGTISGTSTVLSPQTEYTVTATSGSGNLIGKFQITVNDIAPSGLSYTTPNVYTRATAITNLQPTVSGGAVLSYSITPTLPTGLTFNSLSGVISGTPTIISPSTNYTVTASNTGGTTTTVTNITVNDIAPSNLAYPTPKVFTKGTSINVVSPTVNGGPVTKYTILPNLPNGLKLDTLTGNIFGTPTVLSTSSNYTITASNTGGESSALINITVNDIPPSALSYTTPNEFFKDRQIVGLLPTISGGAVTSYSINPALPTGLTIDGITGVITGTSSILSNATDYTVTASNTGGSTTAIVNIKVILYLYAKDSILQQNNCINDSIGRVVVFAKGGYAPYQYAINGGPFSSSGVFINLKSGVYTFSLKDSTGAIVTVTDTIKTLSNTPLRISISSKNVNCFGQNEGAVIVDSVKGGVKPYLFNWSNGSISDTGIKNLKKGIYDLKVKDFYGCKDSVSVNITEPSKLVATSTYTSPKCFNEFNGAITLTTTGGTGSYSFLWNNAATTSTVNNLNAGTYSVTIKDSLGCSLNSTFTLSNPLIFKVELDSIFTICTNQFYKKDVTNKNYPAATFSWTSDIGYSSTSNLLSTNKAGTYIVTGTNPNGCISKDTMVLKMQNTTIESVFAVASNIFQNDTLHIVNISLPKPDKSIWYFPIDTAVKLVYSNPDSLRLSFKNEGTYTIKLNTQLGACIDSSSQTINVLKSSGIKVYNMSPLGLNSIQGLAVSPNPSSGRFVVSLNLNNTSAIALRIISMSSGRVVFNQKYASDKTFSIPLNLSLSADVYALIVETEFGASAVHKILIL